MKVTYFQQVPYRDLPDDFDYDIDTPEVELAKQLIAQATDD